MAVNEPWGRERIGSCLSLVCPSLEQLLNFPETELFHGIGKFADVVRLIQAPMPVVVCMGWPFSLFKISARMRLHSVGL